MENILIIFVTFLFISKSFVNFEQKIRNRTFDFASFEKKIKGHPFILKVTLNRFQYIVVVVSCTSNSLQLT